MESEQKTIKHEPLASNNSDNKDVPTNPEDMIPCLARIPCNITIPGEIFAPRPENEEEKFDYTWYNTR